ncbi:hypothetical protein A9P82_04955 [Arachidicoccus ginsenosidimutans]|nr:hypothetical protein A9P82_04955 [Arachidicoccus sp. BS20]
MNFIFIEPFQGSVIVFVLSSAFHAGLLILKPFGLRTYFIIFSFAFLFLRISCGVIDIEALRASYILYYFFICFSFPPHFMRGY